MWNMKSLSLCLSVLFSVAIHASAAGPELSPEVRIDQMVGKQLREQGLKPNRLTTDEVFVRRIYLDLIGRIPTRAEAVAFIESEKPDKRAELINSLIGSEGYVSHQYNYWADLLRARTTLSGNGNSAPAGYAYERWIKDAIRTNKPYDKMVYELVTATGSTWENPAVGYYIRDFGMPLDNLAITSQVFLGTQIVCAQCHNHPFDEWTQMDYYHLSAFTYPLATTNTQPVQKKALSLASTLDKKAKRKLKKNGGEGMEMSGADDGDNKDLKKAFSEIFFPVRFNNVVETNRQIRLPHDYKYDDAAPKDKVDPKTPFGNDAVMSPSSSIPGAFGEWLTSPENPRFTKVMANRMWKRAMGVGLIEPVDDFRSDTKASNPELMDYLEKLLADLDYDLQAFQRILYNTKTYQREASLEEPVPGAPYYFAGPILRRMTAEQVWDSIVSMVVDSPDAPDLERELQAERKILTVQLVAEAIYDQSPRELLQNAREVADIQMQLAGEIDLAQQKVVQAREDGDPDLIRQASAEVKEIRRRLDNLIEERVYRDGLQDKLSNWEPAALTEATDAPAGDLSSEDEFLSELASAVLEGDRSFDEGMSAIAGDKEGNGIVNQLVNAMLEDKREAILEQRDAEESRRRVEWGVQGKKDKNEKLAYRSFKRSSGRLKRASDITSPAPPGHFLREFGQSDRELVENSSDQASITQALAMLNGPTLGAVTNKFSVLSRDMKGHNFKDRLDIIYMTMLSRLPSPEERAIFREAWAADPESGTVSGIVWTILNTRQFLFIQ